MPTVPINDAGMARLRKHTGASVRAGGDPLRTLGNVTFDINGKKIPFSRIVDEMTMSGSGIVKQPRGHRAGEFIGTLGGETKFIIAPRGKPRESKKMSACTKPQ